MSIITQINVYIYIYSCCWVIIYCPKRRVVATGWDEIYCMIDHMDKTQIIPYRRCSRLENQAPALIRYYSEFEEEKTHVWKKGKDVFRAANGKYPQPVYYLGTFIMNKNRNALIRYDYEGSIAPDQSKCKIKYNKEGYDSEGHDRNGFDKDGYCKHMKMIPRQDICGLTTIKTPSICKIISIKDTAAFIQMVNEELSQQVLSSSQQQQSKSSANKYSYNIQQHVNEKFPFSPDDSDSDDSKQNNSQNFDSDGDLFMDLIDKKKKKKILRSEKKIDDVQQSQNLFATCGQIDESMSKIPKGDDQAAESSHRFINKTFIKPNFNGKQLAGAQRTQEMTKHKAIISTKQDHRTQIKFSTKVNFCYMVESGMTHQEAWNWCKKNGFEVGKGSSGCGRWARKGSTHYLRLMAKNGDQFKLRINNNYYCVLFQHILNLYINRNRINKAKYPKLEKLLIQRIDHRCKFGLYRTMPSVQALAKDIAHELGIKEFKASRHWINNFSKRHNLKWQRRTTSKQQTIYSFLACWHSWIQRVRRVATSIGIVTPLGYIKSYNVWNADEFAIDASSGNFKHLSHKDAQMVNSQSLKFGHSANKRYCTVTCIVPKSGYSDPNC